MKKTAVLVIAGPTASGKTALAVNLAKKYDGEVVSADSMQIYKRMNIGTAKPSKEEMCGVPHHMMDFLEPSESYSVAQYVEAAHKVIEDIAGRGKLPIVAGGTGLYINSLIDDVDFTEEKDNGEVRRGLAERLASEGIEGIFAELCECDPVSAEKIHPNNAKRVIRALEYFKLNGTPISQQSSDSKESRYTPLMLMIDHPRDFLYERVEKRVDIMLDAGLIDEVKGLMAEGLTKKNLSMQGIGYKEVIDYLRGFTAKEEMIRIIKRDTRRYAKRQLTWFNRDERMTGISGDLLFEASRLVDNWIV